MRCPRCSQMMHKSAEECPHCGLTLEQLDVLYDGFERRVRRPHDAAGVLRVQQRRQVAAWLSKAERAFPQLYFSVATVSLSDEQNLHSYGYWLMNRGEFEDVPESAVPEGALLLVIDVNRKEVCLHVGYLMAEFVDEEAAFDVLVGAHPYLLELNYLHAIEVLVVGMRKYAKRLSRAAQRAAKKG